MKTSIIQTIEKADASEIGRILEEYNRSVFTKCDGNLISVKASYALHIAQIDEDLKCTYLPLRDYGNLSWEDESNRIFNTYQTIANLELAKEFFSNPPVPQQPIEQNITPQANETPQHGEKPNEESVKKTEPPLSDWMDTKEVCKRYNLSYNNVKSRKWRIENSFPTHQKGAYSKVSFNAQEVTEWLSKQKC